MLGMTGVSTAWGTLGGGVVDVELVGVNDLDVDVDGSVRDKEGGSKVPVSRSSSYDNVICKC